MPKEKRERKPFNETGLGKFLKEKVKPVAGDVLELVGEISGVGAIEKVGELLNAGKEGNAQMAALASEFELKKLEWQMELDRLDHEYRMAEMQAEVESFKAEVQDRDSARTREVSFMQANGGKRDWLMGAVVLTGLLSFIGVIIVLVFVRIPEENQRLADMCFGSVMSLNAAIFSYYVGSSRGSKMKDDTIRKSFQ
jgi:VIT1/CCC1 family predicted Fe2+/Mn2+ transporter